MYTRSLFVLDMSHISNLSGHVSFPFFFFFSSSLFRNNDNGGIAACEKQWYTRGIACLLVGLICILGSKQV